MLIRQQLKKSNWCKSRKKNNLDLQLKQLQQEQQKVIIRNNWAELLQQEPWKKANADLIQRNNYNEQKIDNKETIEANNYSKSNRKEE
jgi:hypothetical protein